MDNKVTICVPSFNNEKTIQATLFSCMRQDYKNLEILVNDDGSTDKTMEKVKECSEIEDSRIGIFTHKHLGQGTNLTMFKTLAQGEYLVYMCADDLFAYDSAVKDIVRIFNMFPCVGHVSRWYYQFLDGYPGAVRLARDNNIYRLGGNPSGLAYRKQAMVGEFSNYYFIESVSMVQNVLKWGWQYYIIEKDVVAVRIGNSTATSTRAYETSPIMGWYSLFGDADFVIKQFPSLIQVKTWGTYRQLLREIYYLVKIHPLNLLDYRLWIFSLASLIIPRKILHNLNRFFKHRINRYFLWGGTI